MLLSYNLLLKPVWKSPVNFLSQNKFLHFTVVIGNLD